MPSQHIAPPLSDLDLAVARSVPPGGNWKDVPVDIPLKRLETIRASFARGEGSRSTYYGRLHPDRPSYTINTYFTRPGNGCHLHYDFEGGQHRTLSYREAARLQSFPDGFFFEGAKTAIAKQVGNAVPPLLGYSIAHSLGQPGSFVDLFSGAGGLGLGFQWAGWLPVVASDFEQSFLQTYAKNIHPTVVLGDIRDTEVRGRILDLTRATFDSQIPLAVLGGPPCQGFSTAGKRRTMEDERNHLFRDYLEIVDALKPDLFVFENVMGLLSMEKGAVYRMITDELSKRCDSLEEWVLHAHQHGVPQRRSRVVLVGHRSEHRVQAPQTVTEMDKGQGLLSLHPAVSVRDALGDLPALMAGQDGELMPYAEVDLTNYQQFMRGRISASEYFSTLVCD